VNNIFVLYQFDIPCNSKILRLRVYCQTMSLKRSKNWGNHKIRRYC